MKKITITIATTILGILFFASPVVAATTASISPNDINVTLGQKFSITISVNPQGTANYAEKLEINYPADILEVKSFTLGSNWIAMAQSGYDSIDNTNGVLIKTAGYPGGLTSLTHFGTVTFNAKKAGKGVIKIGDKSLAFEANSQSTISGNNVSFSVIAPKVIPKVVPDKPIMKKPTITPEEEQAVETATTSITQDENPVQAAAITVAVPEEASGNSWIWIVVILGITILAYGIYILKKKD